MARIYHLEELTKLYEEMDILKAFCGIYSEEYGAAYVTTEDDAEGKKLKYAWLFTPVEGTNNQEWISALDDEVQEKGLEISFTLTNPPGADDETWVFQKDMAYKAFDFKD